FGKELEKVKDRIENGEREIFKENAKIKLGYLFCMNTELEDDLNNDAISEELSNTFANSGFTLSGNVTITNSDDEWEITDDEKKFIVRKEEGKLSVYRSLETEQERNIRKRIEQMEEKIKLLKQKPTLPKEFDSMLKDSKELKELKEKVESLGKTIPSEDIGELKEKVESLGKTIPSEGVELMPKDIEELKEKVESLSSRSETLEAEKEQGILNRLKRMVKIKQREVEVLKPSLPEDKINSILKDSEELKELREKVESLSSRSKTLEAGEKLSTLYWLKQMTEINSISKDIEELKKLKDKVEPLGKTIPSKDFKELRERVESLSRRSETLEANEKLGILSRLKQVVKTKTRHVEVSKPSLPEDINLRLKNMEEELKEQKGVTIGEEEEGVGGRRIEEEMI
ncbi:MAG: hypothetical protein KAS87_03225, partial [Candidatus Omnitrophica bacterium]|nr:hypothetical protein [Candidatus Omnitrophota bacterium]